MDYFVSVESNSYFRWQIELLAESFKQHGLLDNLVVAVAETDEPWTLSSGRPFYHENIGRKMGYVPLNKPYSLISAIKSGLIKQPFVCVDPDMILCRPIPDPEFNFVFQEKEYMTLDHINDRGCEISRYLADLGVADKLWIPGGTTMVFNDVPEQYFHDVVRWNHQLLKDGGSNTWWCIEMVAWVLARFNYHDLTSHLVTDYEMHLVDSKDCCLIHYHKGCTPYFSKKDFLPTEEGFSFKGLLPYKAILQLPVFSESIKMFKEITLNVFSKEDNNGNQS